jgi:hypothetical protein
MSHAIYMTAEESAAARPFTDPAHIPRYQQTLSYMARQVCLLLDYPYLSSQPPHIICFNRPENRNWFHRIVIAQPEELLLKQPLTIVGFFGNKRPDANIDLAHEFDRTLVDEIPNHPGLYSYSTMALENGNYGNLVVFADDAARYNWSTSQAHAQAVKQLSPNYYHNVTIFNGQMPNGIHQYQDLTFFKAKYYDYQCQPQWAAVRKMNTGESGLES